MRNKRNVIFILFSIVFLLLVLTSKSEASLNITTPKVENDSPTVSISSDKKIDKLYIYKKNSKNRFTLLIIQNGGKQKSVQLKISINHLSSTNTSEFKAIALYDDDTAETKTFNLEKKAVARAPIKSSPIPSASTPVAPKVPRTGMTAKPPTPKTPPTSTPPPSSNPPGENDDDFTGADKYFVQEPKITGTTYYVSVKNGNNSNPGTKEKPFKTIEHGIDTVKAGDALIILSGTYKENNLEINKSATSDKWITIKADNNVYIDGNGGGGTLLDIESNSKYIYISGINFQNLSKNDSKGIYFHKSSSNVVINDCKFSNIKCPKWKDPGENDTANAIFFEGSGNSEKSAINHITIQYCELENILSGYSEGISVDGNCSNINILNVKVTADTNNRTNIGICLCGNYGTSSNKTLDRPRHVNILECEINNAKSAYDSSAYGIYVDGGYDVNIENNVIKNSNGGIEVGAEKNSSAFNSSNNRETQKVTIKDNEISDCKVGTYIGADYEASNTGTVNNVVAYHNTYTGCGTKDEAIIQIDKSNDVTFGGSKTDQKNIINNTKKVDWKWQGPKATNIKNFNKSNNIIK